MSVRHGQDDWAAASSRRSSVVRSFAVLQAIAALQGPATLSEIARKARLPKTTAYRLLTALLACDAVCRVGDRYDVGTIIRKLGTRESEPHLVTLRRAVKPILVDLCQSTGGVAALCVARGVLLQQLDAVHGHGMQVLADQYGEFGPMHCTAGGKALLAFNPDLAARHAVHADLTRFTIRTITAAEMLEVELAATRARGLAIARAEYLNGVMEMAVPLLDANGNAIAAITVVGRQAQYEERQNEAWLRAAAASAYRMLRPRVGQPRHSVRRVPQPRRDSVDDVSAPAGRDDGM